MKPSYEELEKLREHIIRVAEEDQHRSIGSSYWNKDIFHNEMKKMYDRGFKDGLEDVQENLKSHSHTFLSDGGSCTICGKTVTELLEENKKSRDLSLETDGTDVMVKIDGRCFYCHCFCNVFRKLKNDSTRYVCNSCGELYKGE